MFAPIPFLPVKIKLSVGNGFFKPNIPLIVEQLYPEKTLGLILFASLQFMLGNVGLKPIKIKTVVEKTIDTSRKTTMEKATGGLPQWLFF